MTTLPEPYIPHGWTIEWDNGDRTIPGDLTLHWEPEQKDGYLRGSVMRERMRKKGLSAAVLDYLLENPDLIPEEWKGKWVFFWGTIYRDRDGDLCVRCLYWDDGRWGWSRTWLDDGWDGHDPAALRASTSDALPSVLTINGVQYVKRV